MKWFACLAVSLLGASAVQAQCSSFLPVYPGLNGPVRVLGSWTPDGVGPARLVAGGEFTWNEGLGSQDYIAWWDGTQWSNIGWGPDAPVNAITTWDPDGDGPLPAQLIMGGEFPDVGADSTGAITVNYIARWDGVAWQPLGTGADGPVDALTTWDPDGDGPLPAELVAAGRFTHIGGVWTGGVAHWDGTAWHSFGWGIDGSGATLTVWDPDGDGPQIPNLVVGGSFMDAGAGGTGNVVVNNVARWDGAAWTAMGGGFDAQHHPSSFVVFRPDAAQPSTLFALTYHKLWRWGGQSWSGVDRVFASSDGYLQSLVELDPDGQGPMAPLLYGAGASDNWNCVPYEGGPPDDCHWVESVQNGTTSWDGSSHWGAWEPTLGPVFNSLASLSVGDGSVPNVLLGTTPGAPYVYQLFSPPTTISYSQPQGGFTHLGGTIVAHFSMSVPASYQWWYDFPLDDHAPLHDGVQSDGSIVSGAQTDTITITNVSTLLAAYGGTSGRYLYVELECLYGGAFCHAGWSDAADFRVSRCSADFNHDGDVGTDQDIEAFFACLAGNCCAHCDGTDFNGDGDVGTDQDIEAFFRVLGGGGC